MIRALFQLTRFGCTFCHCKLRVDSGFESALYGRSCHRMRLSNLSCARFQGRHGPFLGLAARIETTNRCSSVTDATPVNRLQELRLTARL